MVLWKSHYVGISRTTANLVAVNGKTSHAGDAEAAVVEGVPGEGEEVQAPALLRMIMIAEVVTNMAETAIEADRLKTIMAEVLPQPGETDSMGVGDAVVEDEEAITLTTTVITNSCKSTRALLRITDLPLNLFQTRMGHLFQLLLLTRKRLLLLRRP